MLSQRRTWPFANSHREKLRGEHPWQQRPKQTRNNLSIDSLIDQSPKTTPTGGLFRGLQIRRGTASSNTLRSSGESVRTELSPHHSASQAWASAPREKTYGGSLLAGLLARRLKLGMCRHPVDRPQTFLTSGQQLKLYLRLRDNFAPARSPFEPKVLRRPVTAFGAPSNICDTHNKLT
jgi:hypothetical protein